MASKKHTISEEDLEAGESTGEEKAINNLTTKKEKKMKPEKKSTKKTKKAVKNTKKTKSVGRPQSKSGEFKNVRAYAEHLFKKNADITREEFIKAVAKEFPGAAAGIDQKTNTHHSWYKSHLLGYGDWKYETAPKSKVKTTAKIKKTKKAA